MFFDLSQDDLALIWREDLGAPHHTLGHQRRDLVHGLDGLPAQLLDLGGVDGGRGHRLRDLMVQIARLFVERLKLRPYGKKR